MVFEQSFGRGSKLPGTAPDTANQDADVTGNDGAQHGDDWQDELLPKVTIKNLFRGREGTLVMGLGVLLPSFLFALFPLTCMDRLAVLLFDHPLETIAELMLVVNIPLAIFISWSKLVKDNHGYSLVRGISMGASIGASLTVAAVSIAAAVLLSSGEPALSALFGLIAVPSLLAAAVGAHLVNKVRRTRDFASSRARVLAVTGFGVLLSILSFLGAEAKPWLIRMAERQAVSASPVDQKEGLNRLISFYPLREMLIECSDARASGLCGVFLPLTINSQRELYFAMTGEPFSFRDINNKDLASVSDESLARQTVGQLIDGLSLLRSSMTGVIHPDSLSSTIDWTFVFKNDNASTAEARAEIAIPRGAVVTNLTMWSKGEPHDAGFCDPARFGVRSGWTENNVSALITDLGRGRMLVSCTGVEGQGELKMRMTTVVPMKPDGPKTATLSLPKFVASNFSLAGEHQLRLRSPMSFTGAMTKMKPGSTPTGEKVITADLDPADLTSSDLMITAERPQIEMIATPDQSNSGAGYVLQKVEQVPANIPSQLVVVIDGSLKMEKYRSEIAESLRHLPSNVSTSVILTTISSGTKYEPSSVADAIALLEKNRCIGGQDNLKAIIKAAEVAGESRGGAVLWIHGPQPASNREIYIMAQYEARPRFYDLPLESGDTDMNEFFRNYSEIGPFEQLPRSGLLGSDLQHFFAKWKPGSSDYVVTLSRVASHPQGSRLYGHQSSNAKELRMLWANQESLRYLARGQRANAARIGIKSRFVNRACSAVLAPDLPGGATSASNDAATLSAAVPPIDSAATATLSPAAPPIDSAATGTTTTTDSASVTENEVSTDATQTPTSTVYITGLNSGGTVRVNNLANLEALLNIFANVFELSCLVAGLALFIQACFHGNSSQEPQTGDDKPAKKVRLGRVQKFFWAAACITSGLVLPGCVNWLVASARDANLFS